MATVGAIGKNKVVVIKTADRAFGTPSNFGVNLASYNLKPAYVSYHQIAMPNGFYNITTSSNIFTIRLWNPTPISFLVSAVIPTGNYNTTTLLSGNTAQGGTFIGLIATLNAAVVTATTPPAGGAAPGGGSFFQGFADPLTGYFTLSKNSSIDPADGWNFDIGVNQSLDWILGFRRPNIYNALKSATGTVILDLRSPPNIYIRSSLVTGNYLSGAGSESILAIIQNPSVFGQTIFQKNPEPELDIFPLSGQVSQATFQLVDEYGHELKMDTNQDWELSIGFYTP
jgi:hypothetical protein